MNIQVREYYVRPVEYKTLHLNMYFFNVDILINSFARRVLSTIKTNKYAIYSIN